jgi:hypothetical protein
VTGRAPAALGAATVLLVLAAAAVVVRSGRYDPVRAARGAAFQRLVGGLGLGPATDLARCERSFDARIGGACADRLDPLPGGVVPCGHGGAGADR